MLVRFCAQVTFGGEKLGGFRRVYRELCSEKSR